MNVLILVIGKFNPCISSFRSPVVFDRGVFLTEKIGVLNINSSFVKYQLFTVMFRLFRFA